MHLSDIEKKKSSQVKRLVRKRKKADSQFRNMIGRHWEI